VSVTSLLLTIRTGCRRDFAPGAWGDLQKDVNAIMFGGDYPRIKQAGVAIASCTEGIMPVVFKIERLTS